MTGRERWLQTISDFLMFANEIVPSSLSSVSSYLKLLFKSSYTNITRVVLGKATSTTRNAPLKILKEQWRKIMLDIGLIMCPADGLTL